MSVNCPSLCMVGCPGDERQRRRSVDNCPMRLKKLLTIAALFASTSTSALAQTVDVRGAWVRTAVPGQSATGAFMTITAKETTRLIGVASPVAGVAEIHEMKMHNGIMKMRVVEDGLELPAGKAVEFKPGGYHLMLMDLKTALPKDGRMPLTLLLKDAKGLESRIELTLPVSTGTMAHKH